MRDESGCSHPKSVRRDGETLAQLLTRLDLAVGLAFAEDIFTDEVNAPRKK